MKFGTAKVYVLGERSFTSWTRLLLRRWLFQDPSAAKRAYIVEWCHIKASSCCSPLSGYSDIFIDMVRTNIPNMAGVAITTLGKFDFCSCQLILQNFFRKSALTISQPHNYLFIVCSIDSHSPISFSVSQMVNYLLCTADLSFSSCQNLQQLLIYLLILL